MQEVDPSGIGRAVEKGRVAVLQLAVDGGEHAAQDGLAAVPVLLDPEGEVVGQRLDLVFPDSLKAPRMAVVLGISTNPSTDGV